MTDDGWTITGNRINDAAVLQRLKRTIEDESDLIVEHRFIRGASAPHRFVCADFSELERYLSTRVAPGDSFFIWRFEDCCPEGNVAEHGKVPDTEGRPPRWGRLLTESLLTESGRNDRARDHLRPGESFGHPRPS